MNIFEAAVLGAVQGLTEFLPVSSSGHLVLIPKLFGWQMGSLTFEAVTNIATLIAVVVALFSDVKQIVADSLSWRGKGRLPLGWFILLGTIPVVLVGVLFKDQIETVFRSAAVVAWSSIVWGVVLFMADRAATRNRFRMDQIGWKQSLFVGAAQAISLIPGTSRSGITITAGLFSGLTREAATRFAFLLGIPAIAGASLFALLDALNAGWTEPFLPLAVGFFSALCTGFFTVKLLLILLKTSSFRWFAFYRVVLGFVILLWL